MRWLHRGSSLDRPTQAADAVFDAATLSDRGCMRADNEDHVGLVSAPASPAGGVAAVLAIVADGMGGHASGEVASRLAVETIASERLARSPDPARAIASAFAEANAAILHDARMNPVRRGMGTTCTALLVRESSAWCGHVGDSRLYLVRDGGIYRMTEDDSMVMAMVRRGFISADDAHRHEDRNVLERALGTRDEAEIVAWAQPLAVRPGDAFVLCTDGLHDLVADEEIALAAASLGAEAACGKLVALARARGGFDNISVAVVRAALPRGA